jgi:hypothetical protein
MKHTRSRLALSLVVTFVISMIIMVSPTVGFRQDAININMQPQERHSDDTPPYGWGYRAAAHHRPLPRPLMHVRSRGRESSAGSAS